MLFHFGNVLVFLLVGFGFVLISLLIGHLVRPKISTHEKLATYECGEVPSEQAWINFNIRFYVTALLFILFDVEIAFMLPVGVVFRQWIQSGSGLLALAEISLFVLVLVLGLVYAWVKGDLEWVKKLTLSKVVGSEGSKIVPKASKV